MILSIDCGTQSLRAILFSLKGEVIDKEQIPYDAYISPKPGWYEQDPKLYWDSLCKAIKILQKRSPEYFKKIKGVGVTTLRSTMVNVDKDGNILSPSIHWLDQRMAENMYKPNLAMKLMFKALDLDSTLKKMERKGPSNWIRQNQPELWDKTYKYLQTSAYLNYKLSGEFKDSIASQAGYIPFNYKKQRWTNSKDSLDLSHKLYPVEKEKQAELIHPGQKIGFVHKEAFESTAIPIGTPIIACGSDKSCEILGMGVINTKMASLSFGSMATVQTTSKKYFEPIKFFPAFTAAMPDHWNPEIGVNRGFWMISWFKNEFALKEVLEAAEKNVAVEEILNDLLHKSPPGAMGLVVQPYWSPGLGNRDAKGAMIGFGEVHKKEHVYRAVIEGLAYSLLDGMHQLEKRGNLKFERIALSGGASQSDEICQITADVFNKPLVRGRTHETSGLGAAILTAYGVGEYNSVAEAIKSMVVYAHTFEPNPKNIKMYKALYKDIYLKMYKKLEPLYKRIREITNYPEL
jgi:sugar (pentulose or hexulose) kinase